MVSPSRSEVAKLFRVDQLIVPVPSQQCRNVHLYERYFGELDRSGLMSSKSDLYAMVVQPSTRLEPVPHRPNICRCPGNVVQAGLEEPGHARQYRSGEHRFPSELLGQAGELHDRAFQLLDRVLTD